MIFTCKRRLTTVVKTNLNINHAFRLFSYFPNHYPGFYRTQRDNRVWPSSWVVDTKGTLKPKRDLVQFFRMPVSAFCRSTRKNLYVPRKNCRPMTRVSLPDVFRKLKMTTPTSLRIENRTRITTVRTDQTKNTMYPVGHCTTALKLIAFGIYVKNVHEYRPIK